MALDPHVNPATGVWDDNYYANTGKYMQSGGGVPAFNFDYEGEAQKAYGDLGSYYDTLLKQSQGDMNTVLSRLMEDYTNGVRMKQQDTATAKQNLGVEQNAADRGIVDNALARGLYTRSLTAPAPANPETGYGIPDANFQRSNQGFDTRRTALDTDLTRSEDQALLTRTRSEQDAKQKEQENETNLEQQRRQEAASLTDTRAQEAYQKYQSSLYNPSLT